MCAQGQIEKELGKGGITLEIEISTRDMGDVSSCHSTWGCR